MKVISYVYGVLTVIRGDDMYRDYTSKPEFISGSTFYYEPTLKQTDGRELTTSEVEEADKFIDSFEFPKADINVDICAHCVDNDGNYLGYIVNTNKYREVLIDLDDDISNKFYDGTSFVDRLLVNKDTNYYSGIGDTRTALNTYYAPNTIGDTPFNLNRYKYDLILKQWTISLEEAKECKKTDLKQKHVTAVSVLLGDVGSFEVNFYPIQYAEAKAYTENKNTATPFIDNLLLSRVDLNKEEVVDKILNKSPLFTEKYAILLGKFQLLIKAVDRCISAEEVKNITWEN